jgi:two-component system chemotaxis response regulator CheB
MNEPEAFPSRRIRVLVVDDSAVMRSILRMVLDPQPELEMIAAASNGQEALEAFGRLHPDLVLLDIEMPGMNGLDLLSRIREQNRQVPVVMCSTLTWRGARITVEALARGATDYVTKPGAQSGIRQAVETLRRELVPKILALSAEQMRPAPPPTPPAAWGAAPAVSPRVVVIGVSTGGPAALERLLPRLPAAFPLPILIVQHMPRLFTGLLAERLNGLCSLRVREAEPGVRIEPGVVEIARGDWHMELTRDLRLRLTQGDPENFCRPSVDVLFRSAASVCGAGVLGVVLTGMGSDGLAGSRLIRKAGGMIVAQDSATSVVWGMPGAVVQAGVANRVLPLDAIADEIRRCAPAPRPSNASLAAV